MASTTTTPTGSLGTETEHEFSLLRKGLLAITGLGIVGILSELIFLRHWEEPLQLVALAAAVVLGVALLMVAFGGTGVNATSPDELRRAVNEAMDSGKPTLINAVLDPGAGSESGRIGNLNPQSALKKK